jgi:1-acyl-sn-glycerol-3-phosphate acyltransferase
MLDLNRLERIRLSANPLGQKVVGTFLLMPNFELPPRVKIDLEGAENLPDEPVIFALNHTDRYNYWPFQYKLWRDFDRYTATWVKGKYYENKLMGRFMELMNNIPTVSRGYLIARDFKEVCEREPTGEEYRALRTAVDVAAGVREAPDDVVDPADLVPAAVLQKPRNVLGRDFTPPDESYPDYINTLFRQMMRRFVELNVEARDKGLNPLIFPQGTRSIRLSRGRIGLAQMALYLKMPVVPVGCNGSDKVYPGNSPVGSPGHITYRAGEPIYYDDLPQFHIDQPFEPFTPEAECAHLDTFQGYVDHVMERINELLDPPYQFADDLSSDGVSGSRRFL